MMPALTYHRMSYVIGFFNYSSIKPHSLLSIVKRACVVPADTSDTREGSSTSVTVEKCVTCVIALASSNENDIDSCHVELQCPQMVRNVIPNVQI